MSRTAARPMYRMTINCSLPRKIASLQEVSLPPRLLRHCKGYTIDGTKLVFEDLADRTAVAEILGILRTSNLVKVGKKITCSIDLLLYFSDRTQVSDVDLSEFTPTERRQIKALNAGSFSELTDVKLKDALVWARRRRLFNDGAKSWNKDAKPFSVSVSFGDYDDGNKVRRAMGAEENGSGCGFGGCDISFSFDNLRKLVSAVKRLEAKPFRTRLFISRNVFDGRGSFECPIDIIDNKTPQATLRALA